MVSRTNKFRGRSRYHGRGKKAGRGAGKRGEGVTPDSTNTDS